MLRQEVDLGYLSSRGCPFFWGGGEDPSLGSKEVVVNYFQIMQSFDFSYYGDPQPENYFIANS